MRKLIRKSAGWIHASLMIAVIIPLFYSMGAESAGMLEQHLYAKCLVIVLPIATSDFAAEKCKNFLSYLLISIIIFATTQAY